jgi:hypothetical protein
MTRLGHSTTRAALIYQHANQVREREIADSIDAMIMKARKRGPGRKGHVGGTNGWSGPSTAKAQVEGASSLDLGLRHAERATGIEPA